MHPALLQVPQRFRLQVLFLAMALMAGGLSAASPLPSSPASSRVHSLPTGTRPPNLILITVASVRADRFPGRHPGRHVFPRLEQMAQGGFFTSRGRTPVPETVPALASLLTGSGPARHRVYRRGDLGQALPSLATRLQSTGFQTVAMLPAGSNLAETPGLVQGFQQVLTFPPAPAPLAAHLAMNEVKARLGKNPLFFWLHLPGPGTPYVPPVTDFLEFLSDGHNLGRRLDLPVGDGDHLRDVLPPAAVNGPMRSPSFYLDAYDAALRLMDTGAALVWKRLQEDHLDDGTILAFASVHGEALGEHGFWFCHGFTLHEEELTVPILILGPGIRPRHESHGWISLMDLHPTLLHMVGQPTLSRSVEGSDLTARLTGRGPLPERPHYAALLRPPFSRSVLNQGGMKLILAPPRPAAQSNPSWWSTETHRELYDLVADPLETTSIAAIRGTVSHEMEVWLSRHYPALPGTPPAKDRSRHR